MDTDDTKEKRYINHELSWIAFNQRVLQLALNQKSPLLEQAKFSAIFSNNLNEFFMVRVAALIAQLASKTSRISIDGRSAAEQLQAIHQQLHPLLSQQHHHLQHRLLPELEKQGIGILDYPQLSRRQKDWLASYFQTNSAGPHGDTAEYTGQTISLHQQPEPQPRRRD